MDGLTRDSHSPCLHGVVYIFFLEINIFASLTKDWWRIMKELQSWIEHPSHIINIRESLLIDGTSEVFALHTWKWKLGCEGVGVGGYYTHFWHPHSHPHPHLSMMIIQQMRPMEQLLQFCMWTEEQVLLKINKSFYLRKTRMFIREKTRWTTERKKRTHVIANECLICSLTNIWKDI